MADEDGVHRHGLLMHSHGQHSNNNRDNNKQGAGILLRTLRKGNHDDDTTDDESILLSSSRQHPKRGDSCLIHYEGFLEDGNTKIIGCSSRDISQPLRFDVGAQQVLEGIDVAVQHMTVGQVAEITIPHCYGYGASGYPPHIPPKATLVFRIELLDIQQQQQQQQQHSTVTTNTNTKRGQQQQQQQQQQHQQHRRWIFFCVG